MSLLKVLYLSTLKAEKKWSMRAKIGIFAYHNSKLCMRVEFKIKLKNNRLKKIS